MQILVGIHDAYCFCIQPTEANYFEVKRALLYLEKLEACLIVDLVFDAQILYGRLSCVSKRGTYVEPRRVIVYDHKLPIQQRQMNRTALKLQKFNHFFSFLEVKL